MTGRCTSPAFKGLSQTDLGKRVGVSQRVVTYYEVRGVSPTPELLVRIAGALDVSTDVLLGGGLLEADAWAFF